MELRGERECQSCGTKWSYYETGEITCPACGSIRSVGLDEPTAHTAGAAELDLTDIRNEVGDVSIETLADDAAEAARTYLRSVGFVDAGELQPLSDTVLAASELRRVGATLGRVMRVDEDEELYLLELLRLADQNDRPAPDEVLETLAPERGLGVAAAVDIYLRDLGRVYEDRDPDADRVLSSLRSRRKRIEALDGDVDPTEAEGLVRTTRDVSAYLRQDDEAALARALERL
ncbi:DUF7117 family protein [Halovenus salina]|uniref:DUF7117 family protein n=1 Tax=Halovenus salina TaxID=1510225 RepID=UPI002260934C|nr:TFIIB-type zinc ribbon-containing protein [Halovenus salina]